MSTATMDNELTTKKCMSMYLSTKPSEFQELFYQHLMCDVIYSKPFRDGTLYSIGHTNPSKTVLALDNMLKLIETAIGPDSTGSHFQCISNTLSKKVKTFTVGEHMSDELYNAIFSNTIIGGRGKRTVHSDVKICRPPSNAANGEVQPKAPKRKRVVAAVGNADEERDGMQHATLESKSQVTRAFAVDAPMELSWCYCRLPSTSSGRRW